jgi:hypothetical protein
MIDYNSVIAAVTTVIKTETTRPVLVQGSNNKVPPYPYCSYTVTSPFLKQTHIEEGETLTQDAELVISLTWASKDNVEAMSLTQRTATLLDHPATRQKFADVGLSVVRTEGFGNRDTFLTIDVERRYGFDLRLRTRHTETKTLETVETLQSIIGTRN